MDRQPLAVLLASAAAAVALGFTTSPAAAQVAGETPIEATVTVDAAQTLRKMDPQRLGGTNVALFGGIQSGVLLNDTWEWDGVSWIERTPAAFGQQSVEQRVEALDPFQVFGGQVQTFCGFQSAEKTRALLPRSSPSFINSSFLWANSPQT